MLKSLVGLVEDTIEIATSPVKIAADVTRSVTRPLADAAKEAADTVNDLTADDKNQQTTRGACRHGISDDVPCYKCDY